MNKIIHFKCRKCNEIIAVLADEHDPRFFGQKSGFLFSNNNHCNCPLLVDGQKVMTDIMDGPSNSIMENTIDFIVAKPGEKVKNVSKDEFIRELKGK